MILLRTGVLSSSGVAGVPYWITVASAGVNSSFNSQSPAIDSNGNRIYCGGIALGTQDAYVLSLDFEGALNWARRAGITVFNDQVVGVAVDSNDDIYAAGAYNQGGTPQAMILKYDSTGSLTFQKYIGSSRYFTAIAIDGSDNIYCATYGGGNQGIVKYNTSGVVAWDKYYDFDSSSGICTLSTGDVALAGIQNNVGTGNYDFSLNVASSTGTALVRRALGQSGNDLNGVGIARDNSDNIFITGQSNISGNQEIAVAKYNSSGTLQWQRLIGGASVDNAVSAACDSSGNVYIVGSVIDTKYKLFIGCWNSSGILQWQNTVSVSGSNVFGTGVSVDDENSLNVCGLIYGITAYQDSLAMRLPIDGSGTGTYTLNGVNVSYSNSSFTETAGTLTSTTQTATATNWSMSAGNLSLTTNTVSPTIYSEVI